eukprot:m.68990 g.68990  ORF g.68990 m.68990 type:complete len:491 (+) comp19944_c0_seq4:334-1806(+)
MQMSYHNADENGVTHLEYDVTTDDTRPTVSLEAFDDIEAVACNETALKITLASGASHVHWPLNALITVRRQWQCNGSDSGNLVRAVAGTPSHTINKQGLTIVHVPTVNASFSHIFKQASISYFSNHSSTIAGSDSNLTTSTYVNFLSSALRPQRAEQPVSDERRRSLWKKAKNFGHKVASGGTKDLKQGASDVTRTAEHVGTAIQNGAEDLGNAMANFFGGIGDFDFHPGSISHQWHPRNFEIKPVGGVTFTAGFGIGVSTNLELEIKDFKLSKFVATVSGDASFLGKMQVNRKESADLESPGYDLKNVTLIETAIPVGPVLVPVELKAGLFLSASVDIDGEVDATGSVSADGSVTLGLQYPNSDGENEVQWVYDHQFQSKHAFTGDIDSSISLGVTLAPKLVLEVAYLGGPDISTPYTVAFVTDEKETSSCKPSLTLSVQDGFQILMGAEMSISVGNLDFDIWHKDWSVFSLYESGMQTLWSDQVMCKN